MITEAASSLFARLAPAGYHIALRIGFAFPLEDVNHLSDAWVQHYTTHRFVLTDPVLRWNYANIGTKRWSEIDISNDSNDVIGQAKQFGMNFGAAVSVSSGTQSGQRSFGMFARRDREFLDEELLSLFEGVRQLHDQMSPPQNLTDAELQAVRMLRDGMRLKQIAHELDRSEGAVKQRLKNAKGKLGANTSVQAASLAENYGLI